MSKNEQKRKLETLELFSRVRELRPGDYAVTVKMYPIRRAWTYLLKLHRFGYLNRRRDYRNRIVYRLSPRGATRLLWMRRRAAGLV